MDHKEHYIVTYRYSDWPQGSWEASQPYEREHEAWNRMEELKGFSHNTGNVILAHLERHSVVTIRVIAGQF